MKEQAPAEKHDRIINARLTVAEMEISATDWLSDAVAPRLGNMMSVFVMGGDHGELKGPFDRLSARAGEETFQELHEMPFGTYGQFTDGYGVPWILRGHRAATG
jgi:PhnB protein